MTFREKFVHILREYPKAMTYPFKGHPISYFIRKDLVDSIIPLLPAERYIIRGSGNQGTWRTDKKKCLEEGVHAQNLSGLLKHIAKIIRAESLQEKMNLVYSAESRVLYQALVCGMIPACDRCISICPVGQRCI